MFGSGTDATLARVNDAPYSNGNFLKKDAYCCVLLKPDENSDKEAIIDFIKEVDTKHASEEIEAYVEENFGKSEDLIIINNVDESTASEIRNNLESRNLGYAHSGNFEPYFIHRL